MIPFFLLFHSLDRVAVCLWDEGEEYEEGGVCKKVG
jgi:hypothetical protein